MPLPLHQYNVLVFFYPDKIRDKKYMLFDRIDLRFGSNRKTTVPDPTLKISHVQIITKPDPDPELRSDLGYNSLVKLLPGG